MEYRDLTLDRFQEEAVEYIEADRSVLVAAPTGTGKTLIADYLIDDILADGGEAVYTAPVKALSNQKFREYTEIHGRENVGLITGDLVINRDAPLRIMTTEILRNVLLEGGMAPSADDAGSDGAGTAADASDVQTATDVELPEIENLEAVIVDEIHFLDDEHRGTVWEELLIYLPRRVRILGLSATLSNLQEFADWLSEIRDTTVEVVREEQRAVPLNIRLANTETGIVDVDEYDRAYDRHRQGGGGGGEMTKHVDILEMLDEEYFPALYFIFSRSMVERLSHGVGRSRVAGKLQSMADRSAIDQRLDAFEEEHPNVLTEQLRSLYRKGIAGHHAGLHVALKALVERLYEAGLLNIVYCTSTFALGINMPARTVVFDGLTKYDGTDFRPLTVREFMQMGGRAGRRGIDPEGDVVIRQDFDDYDEVRSLIENLRSDASEPVESSFNLSFHSVVNLLDNHDETRIRILLERSFKTFQAASDAAELEGELQRCRDELEEKESQFDSPSPSDLGELRGERKEIAHLERELAEAERPELWEDFQRKVSFLRTHGYIAEDNSLKAPGQILRHVKFEEVFLTELVFRGTLQDRPPNELYGILCGLVHSLPRKAQVDKPRDSKWWQIFSEIQEVHESDIVQGAAELSGDEPTFTPEMMPLGQRWAEGESLRAILQKISNPTDLSGGLVGAFRRAKDLVGQLRQVHRADEHRRRELAELLGRVSRDEVEVLD